MQTDGEIFVMIVHLVALKLMSFVTSWGIMEHQPMVELVAQQGKAVVIVDKSNGLYVHASRYFFFLIAELLIIFSKNKITKIYPHHVVQLQI